MNKLICVFLGHKPNFTQQPDYIYDKAVCDRCRQHIYKDYDYVGPIWRTDKYWDVEEDKK